MVAYLYLGRTIISVATLTFLLLGLQSLLYFIGTLTILAVVFYLNQRHFIYSPRKKGNSKSPKGNLPGLRNPEQQGLNYQDIKIVNVQGNILNGWHMKPKAKSQRIVVFFQGSGRNNIGTKLPFLKLFIEATNSEVIYVAYRGYSDNQGIPTEKGICSDGQQIIKYAIKYKKQIAPHLKIYVLGRSLGGGVAIHACSRNQLKSEISGVILENTFTSIFDITVSFVSWFKYIPFFLKDHWRSVDKIHIIQVPILFIRSLKDTLIKPNQMLALMKKAEGSSSYIADFQIPNGRHHRCWKYDQKGYINALKQFFAHPKVK